MADRSTFSLEGIEAVRVMMAWRAYAVTSESAASTSVYGNASVLNSVSHPRYFGLRELELLQVEGEAGLLGR
jgi:hypothetical protein